MEVRDNDLERKLVILEATFETWQKFSAEGKVAVLEATFETWQKAHATEHTLEAKAVELAYHAIEGKMVELNDVRHRFVDKEWFEKIHGAVEARVTVLEEWCWKIIGMMIASTAIASALGGVIGWALSLYYMHK
jgi:hypothetical protein